MANHKSDFLVFLKFVVTGVLNTAVDAAVFALLIYLGRGEYLAQTVGYGCGMLNSYLINRSWTFRSKDRLLSSTTMRFIIANLGLLLLSLAVIYLAREGIGMSLIITKGAALCCTVGLGFIVNRRWVFKADNQ